MYQEYIGLFPEYLSSRQIIEVEVELVQTSCGYGVPFMDYKEERTQLKAWAEVKGEEKIKEYWQEKNTISLDGHETKIFED